MITVKNIAKENFLVDKENTFITLSDDSWALNLADQSTTPAKRSTQNVMDMQSGKFRKLFNRHRSAYRFFN